MTEIISQPLWSPVRILETHELAMGGLNGNMNEQAIALANRIAFLNQEKASKADIVQGQFSFLTLAEFEAKKATIPINSNVIIDEQGAHQGNNTWNGTVLIKNAYDPIKQAADDATLKANTALQKSYRYTNAHVALPKQIANRMVALGGVDTSQPNFGKIYDLVSLAPASLGRYVLLPAASVITQINRISVYASKADAQFEVRVYSRNSEGVFHQEASVAILKTKNIGLNTFGVDDFLPFTLLPNQYVGFEVQLVNGSIAYSPAGTEDLYWSSNAQGNNDFTGTAGKFRLHAAFYTSNGSERAFNFLDSVKESTDTSNVYWSNVLDHYGSDLGLPAAPVDTPNANAGIGHYIIGPASTGFGKVTQLSVYSHVAGSAQVGIYSRNGRTFTRKRYLDVVLAAGLNILNVSLAVSKDEFVGLRTTVIGMVKYFNDTTGHPGMWVCGPTADPNVGLATADAPLQAYQYQLKFHLELNRLVGTSGKLKWEGLKYTSFGDSITWYNLRTFLAGQVEAGQLVKGYQSYIVEALGCTLDNKGESGWTLPSIYNQRIKPYDFTDVYATTITSGANDHKNGVLVGTVQPINFPFNTATYAGALQASIEHIISSNPNTKIFLITPIKGWYSQETADAIANPDLRGQTLLSVKFANVMKEIGALYSLPVIDWYNTVGFNDMNRYYFLGDDPVQVPQYTLHPKNVGFKRMGEILLSVMQNY
ncbi:SGNH/GDSL hydrolase family protein [Acinetobacter baumannii]|uniref:SGNH/GDSL hydrolase family protein n=1 Tax=Acinetobacter baumannii TaxID=470 RepID=UPI003891AD7E